MRNVLPWASVAIIALASAGCILNWDAIGTDGALPDASHDAARRDGDTGVPSTALSTLDLLLMIDNSNSMRDSQSSLLQQFAPVLQSLTHPPCTSVANPMPHLCLAGDPNDRPVAPAVTDINVGVVSSDLGTPGSSVPGCDNSDFGDDGRLNPIRFGQSVAAHEPWTGAPATFGRPTDCVDPNQYPAFINFSSATSDPTMFTHDFQCNAGLYLSGCGLESQLESVYRALVHYGNNPNSPNAGFVRPDAVLALVWLTDEEDGSVRNCNYDMGSGTCGGGNGALDVYNSASSAWGSANLNLRYYLYQPCGPQDPTWPISRYLDPSDVRGGFLGLKPGHPERVVAAAITGIPLTGWQTTGADGNPATNWQALLGVPGVGGPEDFCNRDSRQALNMNAAEGPVSMYQNNPDPTAACTRTVPACRRRGTAYSATACSTDQQYFAWPARRIVEVMRRFDMAPVCNGSPCHNGMVASICETDYSAATQQIVHKIQARLSAM